MSDVLIELENVGIAFDAQRRVGGNRFWALEDVSVTLRRGERLGVIRRIAAACGARRCRASSCRSRSASRRIFPDVTTRSFPD